MPVEQGKSRKSVPAKTTVGQWCLPRIMVRGETIASSFSFDCVAENIQIFLEKVSFNNNGEEARIV